MSQEKICAFCVLGRHIRPRLRWSKARSVWVCPVCRAEVNFPTDPDQTTADLAVMFREGAEVTRLRAEQQEREYNSKPRVHGGGPIEVKGGSKAGRRSRKPPERYRWYRTYGEV